VTKHRSEVQTLPRFAHWLITLVAAGLLVTGVAHAQPVGPDAPVAAPTATSTGEPAVPVAPTASAEASVPPAPPPTASTNAAAVPVPAATPTPAEPSSLAAENDKPEVTVTAAPGDGATIKAGDVFSLNMKSRFQFRHQLEVPPNDGKVLQMVNINTARLWLSGIVYRPELKYMLQLAFAGRDFRDGATSPIFDAYVDYKAHRDFSVRAGQFFVPFDRLRTVREFGLQMAERPRPVAELTLDRDAGVVFYSEHFLSDSSPLAWKVGAFGGGGTNLSVAKEAGALLVARLELRPLGDMDDDMEGDLERRRDPRLALGVGAAQNSNTNRQRSTTGGTYVGGTADYSHLAADLVFKWFGFALQGEFLWRKAADDTIVSTDDAGGEVTEFTRSGQGWVTQASYVFDPPLEVVGRLARFTATDDTDPAFVTEADDRGQEIGGGLNYYLNGHKLKLQTTWIARTNPDFELGEASHGFFTQLDATF
jgi:hypothetical protein